MNIKSLHEKLAEIQIDTKNHSNDSHADLGIKIGRMQVVNEILDYLQEELLILNEGASKEAKHND